MVGVRKINRSQFIRDFLKAHPGSTLADCQASWAKLGSKAKILATLYYQVRHKVMAGKKPTLQPRRAPASNGSASIGDLESLLDSCLLVGRRIGVSKSLEEAICHARRVASAEVLEQS